MAPSTARESRGLSLGEVRARQAAQGYNELPREGRRTALRIMLEVVREPMLALLIVGGVVYLLLGDHTEAIILLIFASLSVVITVVQEYRTERVLEALRDLTSPRALVVRDGVTQRIAGREVVRGDIVILAEGDRVPADCALIESHDLEVDESLLTGESVAVRKSTAQDTSGSTPGDSGPTQPSALSVVYSGTLVVRGRAVGEVSAIGVHSEIGKIGQTLQTLDTAPAQLKRQVGRVVTVFASIGIAVSAVVALLYALLRGGWLEGVLAGIAVGMSMLPEEFPVVLTVFMAMGAWRISHARVLTRRASAIETLGSATVLCTDKTGTLTENRMSVSRLVLLDGTEWRSEGMNAGQWTEELFAVSDLGTLASAREPVDPMEKAFHELGKAVGRTPSDKRSLVREYGLQPGLMAVSQVWRADGGAVGLVAAKGAPEAIASLSGLTDLQTAEVRALADEMASQGLRVLGIARADIPKGALPDMQTGFRFNFVGLAGLADGLRKSVPAAVAACQSAGIRVVMITGDYPTTARAIARQAGLAGDDIITGDELAGMKDEELARRITSTSVFARTRVEQKLRIVNALKANGEIVAMTGDGVNDAPSLKAAHIGIAMGGRGTDVAREASSIVLLDDDFGAIPTAVRLGRRIYDNLSKAMGFILAVHLPIAGLALLPLIFGLPIILGPLHIAFIEMIIDPTCTLVFESETEEANVMHRPPRSPNAPLFGARRIGWGVAQGVVALALVTATLVLGLWRQMPSDEVRALTYFALVISIVGLIFVNRSYSASLRSAFLRPNRALALVVGGVVATLALTLAWPGAGHLFQFGPLHWDDLLIVLAVGTFMVVGLEVAKWAAQAWGRAKPRPLEGAR